MLSSFLAKVLIGAGIGAALGYFGQCTSGTCPLTATWWRGASYGAVMGLIFAMVSAGSTGVTGERTEPAGPGIVAEITSAQFEAEVVEAGTPVLVDFYASWCGPCKKQAPIVETMAREFEGSVKVLKVNVDKSPDLARRFGVRAIPTLVVFKDGKAEETMAGLTGEQQLRARLRKLGEAQS